MRPGITAVAFDLDGTLYPNYRLNIRLIPFFFKEWRLLLAFGKARNFLHHDDPDSEIAQIKGIKPQGFANIVGAPCTQHSHLKVAMLGAASRGVLNPSFPHSLDQEGNLRPAGSVEDHVRASTDAISLHSSITEAADGRTNFYKEQAAVTASFLGVQAGQIQDKIETLIYRGWEPHFKKIKLYARVKSTLTAFKAAGLKLGLLSDFPPETKIKYLGIDSFWDTVLCTEEIGALKPEPFPFIKLAQALGTEPAQILYVGNSLKYDVIGAKRAGMQTALISRSVWSTGGGRLNSKPDKNSDKPDFIFRDYRQLFDFVLN